MHQVHTFNIQHCVDEPSKLVFGSLNRKKNSKILFEGFPVWSPHVKFNPWVVRPLQHKATQDWCSDCTGVYSSHHVVRIIVFGIIFTNWAKLLFRLHWRLTNSCSFLSWWSLKLIIAILLRLWRTCTRSNLSVNGDPPWHLWICPGMRWEFLECGSNKTLSSLSLSLSLSAQVGGEKLAATILSSSQSFWHNN